MRTDRRLGLAARMGMVATIVASMATTAACVATAQGNPTGAAVMARGHQVMVELPTCNADVHGEVDEQPDAVVVTITVTGGTADDCTDVFHVTLDEPLGDRPLINGHSDERIATYTTGE